MPRRCPAPDEPIARARLRTGATLLVLDISDGGCLTETTERLLPGRRVDVHLMTTGGRVLVPARVVRAYVYALRRDAVRYRAALAFDRHVDASPR